MAVNPVGMTDDAIVKPEVLFVPLEEGVFRGIGVIKAECSRLYPDQPNPLQANSVHKFWLGGPDLLDYVSFYSNAGIVSRNIPEHWHYVSYGLSDLHGDGRVYLRKNVEMGVTLEQLANVEPSGFGCELTFRLKKEPGEIQAPMWPAVLLQQLAKYVLKSGNPFFPGDHCSWHVPLDNSESSINHMVFCKDAQLRTLLGPFGLVHFIQIVGITSEELHGVQRWDGSSFIDIMRRYPACGGEFLVTDMRRGESVFELDPGVVEEVNNGVDREGATLSGVTAMYANWNTVAWNRSSGDDRKLFSEERLSSDKQLHSERRFSTTSSQSSDDEAENNGTEKLQQLPHVSPRKSLEFLYTREQNSSAIRSRDRNTEEEDVRMSLSFEGNFVNRIEDEVNDQVIYHERINFHLNLEAALVLSLALKGRISHGRHFTVKSGISNVLVTLVSPSVQGSFTNADERFASVGPWLHIRIDEDLLEAMSRDLDSLLDQEGLTFPKAFFWNDWNLCMTIGA